MTLLKGTVNMKQITIYGAGCEKCRQTETLIRRVVAELDIPAEIVKVSDLKEIALAGVLRTPAVAVDGVVKMAGRIPRETDIEDWVLD